MMKHEMELTIANIKLKVPLYGDEKNTERIAQQVEETYRQIEAESRRIDTPVSALQTAFSFAVEADRAKSTGERQDEEIVEALSGLVESINALILKFGTPS